MLLGRGMVESVEEEHFPDGPHAPNDQVKLLLVIFDIENSI